MKNGAKIAIVVLLAAAVVGTFALRGGKRTNDAAVPASLAPRLKQELLPTPEHPPAPPAPNAAAASSKPRLLELGSNRCMSCQQMAVVLDALRASQGARLQVDFIDVMENPEMGERYKISLIPTQILYDDAGKELYRHQGFFSHDDILAKFRALGVKL